MKRIHRLRSAEDFTRLFRRGKRIEHPFFRVLWCKNTFSYSRFAVVVSRAVEKKATTRNTLRRRIKEWFRVHSGKMQESIDIALICKKPLITATRKKLYEELENIFKQIRV